MLLSFSVHRRLREGTKPFSLECKAIIWWNNFCGEKKKKSTLIEMGKLWDDVIDDIFDEKHFL